MIHRSTRTGLALLFAGLLSAGAALPTFAQTNNQSGLVNVNLQDIALAVPVSVAVPVGVALNACGVNILALQQAGNTCTATSNTMALSQAVGTAIANGGSGGATNNQSGLVNVNVQGLYVALPVSVALPIGVAANLCGINVLAVQQAGNTCNATSTASANSIAQALAAAMPPAA